MRKDAKGTFAVKDGELWYTIDDVYGMEDFFLTMPSSGDIWTFLWSRGGITSGRGNADHALFPYGTDDRVSDLKYTTGPLTMIKAGETIWKPFDSTARRRSSISIVRNLSKIRFEERNEALGLSVSVTWQTGEGHGLMRKLSISASKDISFTLLDGARNILPAGISASQETSSSTLIDAYRKTELDEESGLVAFSLSSIITDRAEPSEALVANISYFTENGRISLDPNAEENFIDGTLSFSPSSLGERGAAFIVKEIEMKAGTEYSHIQILDTSYTSARFADLRHRLLTEGRVSIREEAERDAVLTSEKLDHFLFDADGIQDTDDMMASVHHEANTLFNIMRGGTFISQDIPIADFRDFMEKRNRKEAQHFPYPEKPYASYSELEVLSSRDAQLRRLFSEYIPLTFSRRHGDPSRPWNHFDISISNAKGEPILSYEGNWRDIFQNWEALCHSFPGYLDHMIARFLNTMTIDGYNPYRINRDGFDWECPDPSDPWAQIGYWNDHQVVYLVRLLKLSESYSACGITSDLSSPRFSSAAVPYRLKSYEEIERDPHHSIRFDSEADREIRNRAKEEGSDGKLVHGRDGKPELAGFATKLLQIIVSKIANLVPDGGIWMNTQRPEWNDANNALAGFGLSIVSTAALYQMLSWFISLLGKDDQDVEISEPVLTALECICRNFSAWKKGPCYEARLATVRANGKAFEKERTILYKDGFSVSMVSMNRKSLATLLETLLEAVNSTLIANKRSDGLFHSYNILLIEDKCMKILPMKLQLEGQVAIMSSGFISPKEGVRLMKALKESPLREGITGAYLLYPDKTLPRFWEKNSIPYVSTELSSLRSKDGAPILEKDVEGNFHFASRLRNLSCLKEAMGGICPAKAAELYEETFHHRFFTGRSDSFFRYEGLGSIYWHMISKLLLALGELVLAAEDDETRKNLIAEYRTLRSSLGYHRSASAYGSFPFMPYSHTPKGKGAKQPGMTGQVKEEIITREIELGTDVKDGRLVFNPIMLEEAEFKGNGTLSFSRFGVPIHYRLHDGNDIMISLNGGTFERRNSLSKEESHKLFTRGGEIKRVDVMIPRGILS